MMGEHNIRELVKSLRDLGVHAGSSSEVIESLKQGNAELRQTRDDWLERAFRAEEQRDELLAACEEMAKILPELHELFTWDGDKEFTEQLRAAIAAAKGDDDE